MLQCNPCLVTSNNIDEKIKTKAGMRSPGYKTVTQALSSSERNLWDKDIAFTTDFNF